MRNITILCSGLLALSLLAAPAKAEPTNNTVYVVFDFGGFDFDGTGEGEEMYENYYYEGTSNLFIINLASINGSFEDFLGLTFNELDLGEIDLTGLSYFILGEIDGSEHLILSATEEGEPIDAMFEERVLEGVTDMGGLDPALEGDGGMAFISPEDFATHFGTGITTFTEPNPDIPFGTVASEGGGSVDMLGFTDPTFLGTISLTFVDGNLIANFSVPEPGFAILAVLGIAGAALARRRRRAAAQ